MSDRTNESGLCRPEGFNDTHGFSGRPLSLLSALIITFVCLSVFLHTSSVFIHVMYPNVVKQHFAEVGFNSFPAMQLISKEIPKRISQVFIFSCKRESLMILHLDICALVMVTTSKPVKTVIYCNVYILLWKSLVKIISVMPKLWVIWAIFFCTCCLGQPIRRRLK